MCDTLLCVGDFNINLLSVGSTYADSFTDLIETYGLSQLVQEPMRMVNTSASLLDLILINDDSIIRNVRVLPVHGFTDHLLVACDLDIVVPRF